MRDCIRDYALLFFRALISRAKLVGHVHRNLNIVQLYDTWLDRYGEIFIAGGELGFATANPVVEAIFLSYLQRQPAHIEIICGPRIKRGPENPVARILQRYNQEVHHPGSALRIYSVADPLPSHFAYSGREVLEEDFHRSFCPAAEVRSSVVVGGSISTIVASRVFRNWREAPGTHRVNDPRELLPLLE